MSLIRIDIKENATYLLDPLILNLLLLNQTTHKNIIWATDDYASLGEQYTADKEIIPACITGMFGNVIKRRSDKSRNEQLNRVHNKAEVFTPSWICNCQNNLVDNTWFGRSDVFNMETEKGWVTHYKKVIFPNEKRKSWQDYVKENRLEITCGEAPYLASRYDAVTGKTIPVKDRIGMLDRKLRIVSENVDEETEWLTWAKRATQSVYGFEWQGDNVLLARENLLFTVMDFYEEKFHKSLAKNIKYLGGIAHVLSWNIWQMDGLKFVVPNSCTPECIGCKKHDISKHNGVYCRIYDWSENRSIEFHSLYKE